MKTSEAFERIAQATADRARQAYQMGLPNIAIKLMAQAQEMRQQAQASSKIESDRTR